MYGMTQSFVVHGVHRRTYMLALMLDRFSLPFCDQLLLVALERKMPRVRVSNIENPHGCWLRANMIAKGFTSETDLRAFDSTSPS